MGIPTNINNLINKRVVESERIEFKLGWNPNDIVQSICAFANDIDDFGGGYIIIGVETDENGVIKFPIKGLQDIEIDKIQCEIVEYCKKSISPSYVPVIKVVTYDDARLIVIWAHAGDDRPYECFEDVYKKDSKVKKTFIRKGSRKAKATDSERKELVLLGSDISYDDRINRHSTIMDLKLNHIKDFLYEIKSDMYNTIDNMSLEEVCNSLRIIGGPTENLKPKNVGLLFFSDKPSEHIPYSYTMVDYIPEPTGEEIVEKKFDGPIYRQLKDVLQYIKNNYLETKIIKIDGQAESISVENYPFACLEEIIPNAYQHKSYDVGEPITIRITKDKIEVTSFIGLDRTIKDENIKIFNLSSRRYKNKRVGEFFKELHLVETKNTGIPKAIRAIKKNGSPMLEFEMDDDRTYFTVIIHIHEEFKTAELKSPNKTAELKNNTNKTLEQILLILSDGKEYSNNEIATIINKSNRRTRELLTILIDNKKISSTGATRNKKYKKIN